MKNKSRSALHVVSVNNEDRIKDQENYKVKREFASINFILHKIYAKKLGLFEKRGLEGIRHDIKKNSTA